MLLKIQSTKDYKKKKKSKKKEVNFKHSLDIFVDLFIKWKKWRKYNIFLLQIY